MSPVSSPEASAQAQAPCENYDYNIKVSSPDDASSDDHLLASRVSAALGGARIGPLTTLAGGHSGVTMWADMETDGALASPPTRVVVKAVPPGREPMGRHDVVRQARAITAVAGHAGIVVPRVLAIDEAAPAFFVMAYATGEAIEPVLEKAGTRLDPKLVRRRAVRAAHLLSALHAVDPALLVSEKETPRQAESEVEYWRPTMEATDPTLTSRGPELHDLLMSHTPDAIAPVVVHGDFRLGNILFERADLTGLVDWEIWSIGDPRIDLGWLTTFTEARDFPGAGFEAPGMPRAGELVSVYEGSVGPLGDLRWFAACARYKMAAILGHNIKRHRDGRYHDPYQERLAMAVTSLIDQGIDFVQGRRALD